MDLLLPLLQQMDSSNFPIIGWAPTNKLKTKPRDIMLQFNRRITTWKQFAKRVRSNGCQLLNRLDNFPNSILVTGCQRSGTTMLSRIITQSDGMINYWVGKDDELDAALILSGREKPPEKGRYCFQTTYLNECFREYFDHDCDCRIIWVLRNPYSVVYSMLYHWRRFAFNELFLACGKHLLDSRAAERYERFGLLGVPKIIRACLAYNGKVSQLFELVAKLPAETIMTIEYDELVNDPVRHLPTIFKFIDLSYQDQYIERIHRKSTKKKNLLNQKEHNLVEQTCIPVYEKAKSLLS
jgi:hypothetical protein